MKIRLLCLALVLAITQRGHAGSDPWTAKDTIQIGELSKVVPSDSLTILMVGPRVLYNGAHIKGAIYAGPAGKPEGLENLTAAAAASPKGRRIVIYCGCCPMEKCPNIRPAFQKLKDLGYEDVKVLIVPTDLHDDWTAKGYPVEKGDIPH